MQVAVVRAGAVGCHYGGLLAWAGHDVTFIGRRTHVDAINAMAFSWICKFSRGTCPSGRPQMQAPSPHSLGALLREIGRYRRRRSVFGRTPAHGCIGSQSSKRCRQSPASPRRHRTPSHSRCGLCRQRNGRARPRQASRRRSTRDRRFTRKPDIGGNAEGGRHPDNDCRRHRKDPVEQAGHELRL